MLTSPIAFPLANWIEEIVPNVFQTMVSMETTRAPESSMPAKVERVVGTIGIAGPSVLGAIYLQLTEPLADEVTARLLGMRAGESAKSADVNDAIGELCNMISGGFKSTLMDHGMQCAISTPAIIRGTSFSVEAPPDALPEKYFFECGGHRMAVEIHLQLQPTDN